MNRHKHARATLNRSYIKVTFVVLCGRLILLFHFLDCTAMNGGVMSHQMPRVHPRVSQKRTEQNHIAQNRAEWNSTAQNRIELNSTEKKRKEKKRKEKKRKEFTLK